MERLAVYAGSFDPITNGHLWMIKQGARLFDRLLVAIGINPEKEAMFSLEERLDMIRESTATFSNVEVGHFSNRYLIRYAEKVGAGFILRGIRSIADYEYEKSMRYLSGDMNSSITIVFLMPPREMAEISSSMLKGLIGPEGWQEIVRQFVPAPVYEKLQEAKGQPAVDRTANRQ